MDTLVRRCEKLNRSDHKQSKGRPKKSWSKVIRYDLKTLEIVEEIAQYRRPWKSIIKVIDSK